MSNEKWTTVDQYFGDNLVPSDSAMEAVLKASTAAGLPAIQVAPNQGKLLYLLALIKGARSILEIGTLGGYSAIWLARALPADGRLITLEADAKHAEVARANFVRAGLNGKVQLRLGPALETLPQLEKENYGPFDLIFIDADKETYPEYLTWSLKLSRPGTVIIADNVVRGGDVVDPAKKDPSVQGVRRFVKMLGKEPRITATSIQTVGSKGYDGLVIATVTA